MPVSTSVHISHCIQHIIAINPSSVLDVGCGFGLWGFLCRMQLDVANGRVRPETWQARIDGIEYFEPYIQAHQRALYSSLCIGDIRELADELEPYDLMIAGDVLEHLDKGEGEVVRDRLYAKARMALMVNIPLGAGWEHPEAYGNPQELHRSVWE
ncbi:MAG: class I SAM-dependent methyltransferase, partial [Candidatus Hydrogenedentes bacterium]|nr:class I SAM-dependent methyltransferase [Candidatus Hydrogenedentota bacterium]